MHNEHTSECVNLQFYFKRIQTKGSIYSGKKKRVYLNGAYSGLTANNLQYLQVNFDIGVTKTEEDSKVFQELMAVYVLSKFDLPICRVAVRMPLNLELKMIYITNASCFDVYKSPSLEGRKEKYEARRNIESTVTVPSLQLCTLFNLMNRYY